MPSVQRKAVLVTGAGGFIGGHLVERLLREGARVRALVHYNLRDARGTLDWLAPENVVEAEVVLGELRDVESVSAACDGTSMTEAYGSARTVPITESHPLEPQSPYAASKVAADKVMDSWHRSYDLPVAVVRPFNTYGPRQSARAIIPTIVSQALAGSMLRLGSLHPRRNLTCVDDTVAAFIAVAERPAVTRRTMQLGNGP